MSAWARFILAAFVCMMSTEAFMCLSVTRQPRKWASLQEHTHEQETPGPIRKPYTDPLSGRLTVDVSDLGLSMNDLGKKGWVDPENVHPSPGERGMPSNGYVLPNGNIDWDAMARDLDAVVVE